MTDKEYSNENAKTILQQLGGNKFVAMTGAKNFCAHPLEPGTRGALSFKIPRSKGVRYVKITLTSLDLYDIQFCKIAKDRAVVLSEAKEVYCDMLQEVFTKNTGLYTRLF